jgi:putative phosphoserine phosphatase/1-acylglycerol-3-phosphate O-acyltransferase
VKPVDATLNEIRNGPSGAGTGAFFDFDGTIIQGYSAVAFYRHRMRHFEIGPDEAARTLLAALPRPTKAEQFERIAELGVRSWAGRSEDDLDRLGNKLLVEGIAGALFHDVWQLVRTHLRRGHTVVIASSATRFQVEPMARELGVHHVLCTPVEVEDGICTGRIGGPTLWGPAKADAVRRFADANAIDLAASYAYANGDEDVDFLSTVGHPHVVNPGSGLAVTAARQQWPVLRCVSAKRRLQPLPVGRTAAMWGGFFASVGTGIGLGLVNRNRRQGVDLATSLWGQLGPALGDIRFDVQGAEHLWSHRPAVFLFNHQSSFMDLLISFRLLERDFTIVAKKEIAQLPVIGQLFGLADVAFVDRSNRAKAIEALKPVVQKLRSGISVAVSPEGTRSLTPTVGPFKKGAFRLAMEAGVPIVPVVVRNAGELMWRDSQIARSGRIDVVVHPPIPTCDWTSEELEKRIDEVRQLYVDTLDEWPVHGTRGDKVR